MLAQSDQLLVLAGLDCLDDLVKAVLEELLVVFVGSRHLLLGG